MTKLSSNTAVIVGDEVWVLPAGFDTDGCTLDFPKFLKWLETFIKWAMGFKKITKGCALHDFVCRYGLREPEECHHMLRLYVEEELDSIRAWLIWKVVSASSRCGKNIPLPSVWNKYATPAK
jgi:hypothetical protein